MSTIKKIIILFNPNSTGNSEQNARDFAKLLNNASEITTVVKPTKHAGHAESIAKELSDAANTMLVSSSGDGGYHELINGILARKDSVDQPIAGLLPSGNANDHYHAVHTDNTVQRIIDNKQKQIDVIKVSVHDWTRYAHSYVGLGITPHVGEKLTAAKLNPLTEAWLTVRHLFTSRPVKIRANGKVRRYDSLVFSNVPRMSKYITLSDTARIDDGRFEITGSRSGSITALVRHLFKATTVGLGDEAQQATSYTFTSLRPLALQLDGEVYHFDAGAEVTIDIAPRALACII